MLLIRFMARGEDTVVGVQAPRALPGVRETHFMGRVDTDRNLLFGLLALQNGLIDQAQLVAAFQAWTLEKARPLAEHLVARGDLDADRSQPQSRRWSRGTSRSMAATPRRAWPPSQPAAPLARAWPGSAIPTSRPRSRALGQRSRRTAAGDADRTATLRGWHGHFRRPAVPRPPAARQGRPGRRLRGPGQRAAPRGRAQADPRPARRRPQPAAQRFLLEAEVTGGLEHPGIVPVYGLGTYADGRPYYAMRFIRGDFAQRGHRAVPCRRRN